MRKLSKWRQEIERKLITQAQLARRVRDLARQIERDFAGRDLVVVSLLNGTVMFLADLLRHLPLPMRLDFIGVSSYREGAQSRELIFTKELRLDVRGRDVLLVDDILDTGTTLKRVLAKLRELKPAASKSACCWKRKPGAWKGSAQTTSVSAFRTCLWSATGLILPSAIGTCHLSACCVRRFTESADMKIAVHFYSYYKDLTGSAETTETLPPGSTIADLLKQLMARFPELGAMQNSTLVAVGVDYQGRGYLLKEGDEVSLFPPVQGG